MQPDNPLPISGTFTVSTSVLVMDFDRPLIAGPVDAANWSVHHATTKYNGAVATAATPGPHQVTVQLFPGFPPPSPGSRAYYNPPPFDVRSLSGSPAALFADFPITPI